MMLEVAVLIISVLAYAFGQGLIKYAEREGQKVPMWWRWQYSWQVVFGGALIFLILVQFGRH
jgi:hypothetical protein